MSVPSQETFVSPANPCMPLPEGIDKDEPCVCISELEFVEVESPDGGCGEQKD
jgi:hypothetical protein